jgi:hypothetical protein
MPPQTASYFDHHVKSVSRQKQTPSLSSDSERSPFAARIEQKKEQFDYGPRNEERIKKPGSVAAAGF